MKRCLFLLVACSVLLVGVAMPQVAGAQESLPEEQLKLIKQNCVRAQSSLTQLRLSDAGIRKSRGSLYETISTKLMAPFNSRITYNRLGGLKLTATTMEYDKRFTSFQNSYRTYYDAVSQVIDMNCQDQPVAFYNGVAAARDRRHKLHDDVVALNALLQTYKNDFEDFATQNNPKGAS